MHVVNLTQCKQGFSKQDLYFDTEWCMINEKLFYYVLLVTFLKYFTFQVNVFLLFIFLYFFMQLRHLNFKRNQYHRHILRISLLGLLNAVVMILILGKVIKVINVKDNQVDRNELGPFHVTGSILSNASFVILAQIGIQNRSLLETKSSSKISPTLLLNIKLFEKYANAFSVMVMFYSSTLSSYSTCIYVY